MITAGMEVASGIVRLVRSDSFTESGVEDDEATEYFVVTAVEV